MSNDLSITQEIALIRNRIRSECKTISVRNNTGTAYGWVKIHSGVNKFGSFTKTEQAAMKRLGFRSLYGDSESLSRDERSNWARRLQQNPKAKYVEIAGNWD